jgi:hypothetical protein
VAGLAGTALDRLIDGPPRTCRWCHLLTGLFFLGAGSAAWAVRGHDRFAEVQGPVLAIAVTTLAAGLVLAVWALWRPSTFAWGLAASAVLFYMVPVQWLLREGLPHQTTHALAREYARLAAGQAAGYSYQDLRPSYLYHLGKPVEELHCPDQLQRCLDAGNAVLVRDRVYALLPNRVKEGTDRIAAQELTRKKFYVIKKK